MQFGSFTVGDARRIVVLSAGLGQPSSSRWLGDRLAAAASRALHAGGEQVEVEVVELRDHAVDLANQLVTGVPSTRLADVLERVTSADAIVAVSPVFNASYSGLFKMFVDALPVGALDGVPVLLGATGGSVRHSLVVEHALRPLFAYLRAATTATGVFAATEDWASPGELDARIERAGRELAVLVSATGRARPATVDPYDVSVFSAGLEKLSA